MAMRTNIVLEDDLMKEAFKYSSVKTKRGLVHVALREYVRNHGRLNLSDLRGKITFNHSYDHKKMRRGDEP
jgi:Arc/MetJ family transcription regulator